MPVYKDNPNNRKLDRVGKHYGKAVAVEKPSSPAAIDNTRYRDNRPNRIFGRVGKLIPTANLRPNRGIVYVANAHRGYGPTKHTLLESRIGKPIVKEEKEVEKAIKVSDYGTINKFPRVIKYLRETEYGQYIGGTGLRKQWTRFKKGDGEGESFNTVDEMLNAFFVWQKEDTKPRLRL